MCNLTEAEMLGCRSTSERVEHTAVPMGWEGATPTNKERPL